MSRGAAAPAGRARSAAGADRGRLRRHGPARSARRPRTGRRRIRWRPAARCGSSTPTERSRSKASTGRPSKCAPSRSPAPRPTRPRASCCRASRSRKRSRRRASPSTTERLNGVMIGASFEVVYHVKVPKAAVDQRDGDQRRGHAEGAHRPGGRPHDQRRRHRHAISPAASKRGPPTARSRSSCRRSARTRSASARRTAASTLTLPATAKANLSATCANGGISVSEELKFEATDKSRRHVEGRLNGGGTPIELRTTNGGIRVGGGVTEHE